MVDLTPFIAIDSCKGLATRIQAQVESIPHCKRMSGTCMSLSAGFLMYEVWLYDRRPEDVKFFQLLRERIASDFIFTMTCWRPQPYQDSANH